MSVTLTQLFTSIANAIRTKKQTSVPIAAEDFPEEILSIESGSVSGADAAEGDVLYGKKFYGANGTLETGSIASKTSSDLTASGATVSVPAGHYASDVSKSVATATHAKPTISRSGGTITASHTQGAGYVDADTKTETMNLTTKAAATITPGTSEQTAVAADTFCTGAIKVAAIPNQVEGGTYYATTSEQTLVSANRFVKAAIKLGKLLASNLVAGNVKKGVRITVNNGNTNVYDITGTYEDAITNSNLSAGNIKNGVTVKVKRNGTDVWSVAGTYQDTLTNENLSAANIKNGVTVKVKRNGSDVWSVTGSMQPRQAYYGELTASSAKSFACASNTGVTQKSLYYVSFNPGFVPKVILVRSKSEVLRNSYYDSRAATYVCVQDGVNWWACQGFTVTPSSVIIPISQSSEACYVSAWA